MEERFEEFAQKIHWKVWVVMLVVFGMILLAILLLPLFTRKKNSPIGTAFHNSASVSPSPLVPSGDGINPTSVPTRRANQWASYSTHYFSVMYPQLWQIHADTIPNFGHSWNITDSDLQQSIEIQALSSGTSVQNIEAIFRGLGYSQKTISVSGVAAQEFVGSSSGKKEIGVVFAKNGTVYEIIFDYPNAISSEAEQTFTKFITTFETS